MSGGPLLKVTEGSAVTRMLAATLTAATLLIVANWGYGALVYARHSAAQATTAIAVCDALARTVATGGDPAKSVADAAAQNPVVGLAFVAQEGGVDEFGIARGSQLIGRVNSGPDPAQQEILNHTRALTTAATDSAKSKTLVPITRTRKLLPDGRMVVAVAFRKDGATKVPDGVAVVVVATDSPVTDSAPWRWFGLLLAPLLMWGVGRSAKVSKSLAGLVAIVPILAIAMAAAPSIPDLGNGVLDVVAASHVFAHRASAMTSALQQADQWLLTALLMLALALGLVTEPLAWMFRSGRADPAPYLYVGPAVIATAVLVFVPFVIGVGLAFTDRGGGFVGIDNYIEVIQSFADEAAVTHFWRTLGHTVLWTIANVGLHLTIGLALAVVLNRPDLRGRAVYRLLLIVPWAVPSYITALTWKWLFNTQYGPINAMLAMIGVGQIDWLGQSAFTNFAANLATNVWLGFPFMMVISLGALQSIPADLYEAASIDGASAWQKFRHITLPLLRPALFPAVILGTIWTFNLFNVIYLVSGGGPDHKTEILITEAYYLFTVLRRIGLAAAYSVLIFALLLAYTLITNKLTQATEAVDR